MQQHCIIKDIAAKGRDFVIVGRSADVILAAYKPFNLFVYWQEKEVSIYVIIGMSGNGKTIDSNLYKSFREAEGSILLRIEKWWKV